MLFAACEVACDVSRLSHFLKLWVHNGVFATVSILILKGSKLFLCDSDLLIDCDFLYELN